MQLFHTSTGLSPWMARALDLAGQARRTCPPNPAVGAVIVSRTGDLLGEGHTQVTGGPHAEVMALRDAQARGHDVRGADLWVTLEPCSHQGRTGPCAHAIVSAGIARVHASIEDPNPQVRGAGFAHLRAAGIEVRVGDGAGESRALNIGFFSRMQRARPWVRLKIAASLDGQTALTNGQSQWITGEAARADGHAWRARACAIVTGIGTVLDDNPRLDVRGVPTTRQPRLVLVDSRLDAPVDASIFVATQRQLTLATAEKHANHPKKSALEALGVDFLELPGPGGKVDLAALLDQLARDQVNEVHVEAGHKLNASLLREQLVDELLVYLAPKLIGPGRPMAALPTLDNLAQALPLRFGPPAVVGDDLRLRAVVAGRDTF